MTVLDDYLTAGAQGGLQNVWSCFDAALRDARKATGRNQDTGSVEDPVAGGYWLGAVGYLCLFDQLGTTIELRTPGASLHTRITALPPSGSERAFRKTLYQFSDLNDRATATLWALRNSLAHNYSLVHIPRNPSRTELRHRFRLRVGGEVLVSYPRQVWDGRFPGNGMHTFVSLTRLSDVGETVALRVRQAHSKGAIASNLSDDELRGRYFLAIRK